MVLLVLLVELVVDEGSRSVIVRCRKAVVETGPVVVLGLTDQRDSADDENLNKSL